MIRIRAKLQGRGGRGRWFDATAEQLAAVTLHGVADTFDNRVQQLIANRYIVGASDVRVLEIDTAGTASGVIEAEAIRALMGHLTRSDDVGTTAERVAKEMREHGFEVTYKPGAPDPDDGLIAGPSERTDRLAE